MWKAGWVHLQIRCRYLTLPAIHCHVIPSRHRIPTEDNRYLHRETYLKSLIQIQLSNMATPTSQLSRVEKRYGATHRVCKAVDSAYPCMTVKPARVYRARGTDVFSWLAAYSAVLGGGGSVLSTHLALDARSGRSLWALNIYHVSIHHDRINRLS